MIKHGIAVVVAVAAVGVGVMRAAPQAQNVLTADEKAAGWRLLFDGTTIDQWRGFGRQDVPEGWQAVDGALTRVGRGGDLISRDEFGDFEFAFDWKLTADGANSGVMFHVIEGPRQTYYSGPEMQLLDNAGHPDGRNPETSCGSNYALDAPAHAVCRPLGQWNEARLIVKGAHVEHWMNGEKVVEYELWTPEWTAKVAASKFAQWPEYGKAARGHLALQDHGSLVAFRNLKIR